MLFLKEFPEIQERIIFEIILYVLEIKDISQFISLGLKVSQAQEKQIRNHLFEIRNGKPYEYITNLCNFMGSNFFVNESVLIPRIDTETLVEFIFDLKAFGLKKCEEELKILDICTGSGCIGVSLAKFFVNSTVIAVDISPDALEIAKMNAKNNGVDGRFSAIQMNILEEFPAENFDIIIANPPYIKTQDIKTLAISVQNFEPHLALDGGDDGLIFYKRLVKYASTLKNCDIIFEIGHDQAHDVQKVLEKEGILKSGIIKDFGGNDRGVYFQV